MENLTVEVDEPRDERPMNIHEEIQFVPAGYRLCTHGLKNSTGPVDWSKDVVTIRLEEESHVLGPDEICMVMVPSERSGRG